MTMKKITKRYRFYDGSIDRRKDLNAIGGGFFCYSPFGLYRKAMAAYPFAHNINPRDFIHQYKVIFNDEVVSPGCYLLDTEITELVGAVSGIPAYKVIDRFGEVLSKEDFLMNYDVKNDIEGKIILDAETGKVIEYK